VSIIRIDTITKIYGEGSSAVRALRGVSLELAAGSFTAVMGPSGSGKSTLLNCAAGLETPTTGSVEIDGVTMSGLDEGRLTRLRRERIGFVFQDFNLLPYLTAEQNVGLPLQFAGRRGAPREMLELVGLEGRSDHLPANMSGGQQQRVAIARALVTKPKVVFADEPTGALDIHSAREVLGLLRGCVDRLGQTIAIVTHDPVAASYADRVIFLVDGRITGHLVAPTVDVVAAQMAHLDDLVGELR
jgi:putative ABC transport system ATP-binding protein